MNAYQRVTQPLFILLVEENNLAAFAAQVFLRGAHAPRISPKERAERVRGAVNWYKVHEDLANVIFHRGDYSPRWN